MQKDKQTIASLRRKVRRLEFRNQVLTQKLAKEREAKKVVENKADMRLTHFKRCLQENEVLKKVIVTEKTWRRAAWHEYYSRLQNKFLNGFIWLSDLLDDEGTSRARFNTDVQIRLRKSA